MKILVIGSGGREHAIAWKVTQSPLVEQVFVAPGNGGTARELGVTNVSIADSDIPELLHFAKINDIRLTIVGPEGPLAAGIVDAFSAAGLACFGPSQGAAQLESSKCFSKNFMKRHHIPTATYETFTDEAKALNYLAGHPLPVVIKADGLAAGKGVVIAQTLIEAQQVVKDMLSVNRFGQAGSSLVIEEFLEGEEASFIAMVDGEHVLPLATTQDHKARDNGDKGPNTGGMGAYSPAPVVTRDIEQQIMDKVMLPTVQGMVKEGYPYVGFLYAGVMVTPDGQVKVLEYNCRLGDPETQPIMMRLQSDLVALCQGALGQQLNKMTPQWDERPALGVVLCSGGYPDNYEKGHIIKGLEKSAPKDCKVFHAGTRLEQNNTVTHGGRVLCVTALGTTVKDAQTRAYELAKSIQWDNMFYRMDIGHRAVAREQRN